MERNCSFHFSILLCIITVQSYFQDEMKYRQDKGDTVTYSVVKNNWYVVSGVDASRQLRILQKVDYPRAEAGKKRHGFINSFDFSYPEDEHQKYDPMVSVIAKGFIP